MRKSVKDAVYVEKKKKKSVPVAEAPTITEESKAPGENVPEEPAKEVTFPSINDLVRNVSKDKLEAAQAMGIPIGELLLWAKGVEVKQDAIIEALKKVPTITEKGIAEELYKKSMEQRQQTAPAASTGNVGGGAPQGIGALMPLLSQLGPLLGQGGSTELQDKIMNMALESMGLGNALVKAIIIKTAPELATQLLPPLAGAKP